MPWHLFTAFFICFQSSLKKISSWHTLALFFIVFITETTGMEYNRLYKRLVQRYLDNTATEEELQTFFHLLEKGELDAYLEQLSFADKQDTPSVPVVLGERKLFTSYKFLRYAVAASLIIFLSAAFFLLVNHKKTESSSAQVPRVPQALPGSKKAMLTLSNGSILELNNASQTLIDGSTEIIKQNDVLVYQPNQTSSVVLYNTIVTPNGGEYVVKLSDGTEVWLNAATSLRYPTSFNGHERRVELNGEAYFEVAKNTKQPFIVTSGEAEIKVLGTKFNVMAYTNEDFLKTTLAEGAVNMKTTGNEVLLQPGQGGTLNNNTGKIIVANADVEQDLAWKNGNFYFNKTSLTTIMKQIGRWYDLEIKYTDNIPQKRFVGRISRNTNLSEVLDILRLSDIRFTMNGRTLTVTE